MTDDNKILEAEGSALYQDDSIELRLQELVKEHARERAKLTEIISQLQEENHYLSVSIEEIKAQPSDKVPSQKVSANPERDLGLYFDVENKSNSG